MKKWRPLKYFFGITCFFIISKYTCNVSFERKHCAILVFSDARPILKNEYAKRQFGHSV